MHTTLNHAGTHAYPDESWRYGTFRVWDDELGDWYWCETHPGATLHGPYRTARGAYLAAVRP